MAFFFLGSGLLHEPPDDRIVGGWKPVGPQFRRGHPPDLRAPDGAWNPANQNPLEDMQGDRGVRIGMDDPFAPLADRDLDAELLADFPRKTRLKRFAGPPLPAGELPETPQDGVVPPAGDEITTVPLDQGRGDVNGRNGVWRVEGHGNAGRGTCGRSSASCTRRRRGAWRCRRSPRN